MEGGRGGRGQETQSNSMRHWPQQNYYSKNHKQEFLNLQTDSTKILGRESQTDPMCDGYMINYFHAYFFKCSDILSEGLISHVTTICLRPCNNTFCSSMEQWIAKYIPQNKMIYSDHFTPGKINEINYSNWWGSCHWPYFRHWIFICLLIDSHASTAYLICSKDH
jgi:hypothetical protein